MTTIEPQDSDNGSATPQIVISTVHGNAISVSMDQLPGAGSVRTLPEGSAVTSDAGKQSR
ncbi:hypothetical protein NHH03_07820 [Stieleria sp. TO1_6]|uniref:hypothetical protein n=1 Tax=Stieleria tagensis TaxID=2956795 RepID=UPI00209B65FA|nr:hypothetical protein [Stieleria tagensis]MCO8121640.1 hypothetical protein [Stieleria tagensis]